MLECRTLTKAFGNRQITTTPPHDPYQIIGFGEGGGQNTYKFEGILSTTAAKPYDLIGIVGRCGGNLSVP